MALLYLSRNLADAASSLRLPGAQLLIYNTGGTTKTNVYADAGFITPLSNPVVADAYGIFPQIFAAEGTAVDVSMYTSVLTGSVLVPGRSEVNIVFLGSSTGAITRDFLSNGRFTIRGTGGFPNMEFGDATGDDTGGTGRIGGWLGTQADLITLDAALVNTTGRIKENSKKLPGIIYTDATQVTAQTQVDIALPNDPLGVRQYRLDLWDFSQSGAGNCNARLSFDGGATYPAVAASYNGFNEAYAGAGAVYATYSNTSAYLFSNRGAANQPARGFVEICTPSSGNDSTQIQAQMTGNDNGTYNRIWSLNYGPASSGRADHIRLLMSASTFTFKYRLTVLRGSGDA